MVKEVVNRRFRRSGQRRREPEVPPGTATRGSDSSWVATWMWLLWVLAMRALARVAWWLQRCRADAFTWTRGAWPAHAAVLAPVLAQVSVTPDAGALPGGRQLQQMVNGFAAFALVVLVGSVIGGAVWWASGSSTGNYNAINGGKRMVLMSALGAIIVGAAAALINFFTAMGRQI